MQGREESLWQNRVASSDAETMINDLQHAGYNGLYLNKYLFGTNNPDEIDMYINSIIDVLGEPSVLSEDERVYFWKF